jgi:hypothetical protein
MLGTVRKGAGGLVGGISGYRYLLLLAILAGVAGLAYDRGYADAQAHEQVSTTVATCGH